VVIGEEEIEIFAPVEVFKKINDQFDEAGIKSSEASLRMMPNTLLGIDGEQTVKVMRVIEAIEDLDDVQNVYSNLEVTEEAVSILETA
jgi:transcriptional/translational regulatory protein YebC/TACO1